VSTFHQLQHQLKTLKLSGMLDAIETRVAQAEDGRLGYLEFLELLLEDEIARRARNSLSARIGRAHFDEVKTFEMFDFHADPALPSQQVRDLATCRYVETHACVLICGPVGVGKTHVAQALGVEACRRGYTVLFTKTARFLRDLGGGRADGSWEQRFRRYLKPDLLILDDFAMQEFTPAQGEDLYQLIDERVGRSSLIVTSNRSPQEWYPLFSNAVLAESALDRLAGAAHQLTLTGKSYRPRLRPPLGQPIAPEVEQP
jgi:DNA replication protein DnaC